MDCSRPRSPATTWRAGRAFAWPAAWSSWLVLLFSGLPLLIAISAAMAAEPAEIKIGYLRQPLEKFTISYRDQPAENDGLAGALVAIDDNNTTGKFLNQKFTLEDVKLKEGSDPAAAVNAFADKGILFVVADLEPDALLKAADAGKARGVLMFNVGAPDDRLREEDCRANVVHVAPARSMLADGLAQYLVWKKWRRWLLVTGSHDKDKLLADAYRRAAKRFGAKIVEEREFKDTGGARRTDSGIVQIQSQMPVFTQEATDYDVLVAADESEVFAGYLPYRTWDARPVAGSAGLVPTSWDASHTQWGAIQMQSRFTKKFPRFMTALDIEGWTAVRMLGEAAARTHTTDAGKLVDFIKSPEFSVAAFKGQKLTLRDWNLQLRQPILLSDGRTIVSVSPQEGFLHQVSELDTLGYDRPETKCSLK
ncbi:MAG: ABC transporter substrate-binding protein [Methylobacteriaceae bacterium]|nr:ABC transporter substrate-binding protein [Methylobacteriaceae bacterium]